MSIMPGMGDLKEELSVAKRRIESLSAQVAALTARLYRYDHWTPDHTIEQWLADVQGRLAAADSWIRGERL